MKRPTVRESIESAVDTLTKRKPKGESYQMIFAKGTYDTPKHWAIIDKNNKQIATTFDEKCARLITQRLNY